MATPGEGPVAAVEASSVDAPGAAPEAGPAPSVVSVAPSPAGIRGRLLTLAGGPVVDARVATDDGLYETWSVLDGSFTLEGVPPGEIHLVVEAAGFQSLTYALTLLPGMAPDLAFTLTPDPKATGRGRRPGTDGLTVKGKRKPTGLTRYTLEREILRQVPGTFGDPLRAVQNLPGIHRAPYGLGVLLIRGTGPNDSSTFIDGHEIPLLYHFFAGPSVLAPDMLARIEYLPGNFSARYGRAIGGVLDVQTRRGDSDHWTGSFDLDFFDAGLFAQGPAGEDTNIAVAGRRSYIDAVLRGATAAAGAEDTALLLPVYADYQARVDHRLAKGHRLSALFFGSEDHFSLVGDPGGDGPEGGASGRLGFHRAKFDWDANLGGGTALNVSPVVGVDISSVEADDITVDALVWEYALRADLSLIPLETLTLRTGLDVLGRYADLSASLPFRVPNYRPFPGTGFLDNEPQPLSRTVPVQNIALYVEGVWSPEETGFSLTPGLRADTFSIQGAHRPMIDPRLNARQALTDTLAVKGGIGRFSQQPTEFRLDDELGNPDLDPEWAMQYAVGLEVEPEPDTTLSAEVYYTRRYDLVERTDEIVVTDAGPRPTRFANVGAGRSLGFEVMLRRQTTSRANGWISYSLSRAEEKTAPDAPWQRVFANQTHHLVAVWQIKLPSSISVGTRLQLVSGNPVRRYAGATYRADRLQYEPVLPPDDGESKQALFHQLDLRVDKTWHGSAFETTAHLDLINVENAWNPEFLRYDYRFRESATVRGFPILPSLGVQVVLK